jgi:hypothetical protein
MPLTPRRLIAIAAAYALALQVLVSAFVPLGPAFAASALCLSGHAGDGSAPPPSHDVCPACLSGICHAVAGCDLATPSIDWPLRISVVASVPQPAERSVSTPRTRGFARAPPAA